MDLPADKFGTVKLSSGVALTSSGQKKITKVYTKRFENMNRVEKQSTFVVSTIDIEYNKKLDHRRPCLEDDLTAGSNL